MKNAAFRTSHHSRRFWLTVAACLAFLLAVGPATSADCDNWNTEEFFKTATVQQVTDCLQSGVALNTRSESEGEVTHICRPDNPDGEEPNADNELPNDRGVRLYTVPPQTREAVEEAVNSLMTSADSFAVQMPLNAWTGALQNIKKITGNSD